MNPTASRPIWRIDFTGVIVYSRSMKPPETQRVDIKFNINTLTNSKRPFHAQNLEYVDFITSKPGIQNTRVNDPEGAEAKLISQIRRPPQVNDLDRVPRTEMEGEGHNHNYQDVEFRNAVSTQPNLEYGRSNLDTFSRIQLRQELWRGLGEPFHGRIELFWSW